MTVASWDQIAAKVESGELEPEARLLTLAEIEQAAKARRDKAKRRRASPAWQAEDLARRWFASRGVELKKQSVETGLFTTAGIPIRKSIDVDYAGVAFGKSFKVEVKSSAAGTFAFIRISPIQREYLRKATVQGSYAMVFLVWTEEVFNPLIREWNPERVIYIVPWGEWLLFEAAVGKKSSNKKDVQLLSQYAVRKSPSGRWELPESHWLYPILREGAR